ncbi:hypothetical protein HJFPF1_06251 [Paramyrothecium foliicola]|nr:hypothetical protein HJFPF1_06251 [Paramyrothecium foliicola]
MVSQSSLPAASSPHLILTSPTKDELPEIWTATYPTWGAALDLNGYLERETFLMTKPLAGGAHTTPWILTDSSVPAKERLVLSSCETLRARALVKSRDGTVREGWAHGVASVFTYEQHRGRGYAGKMMEKLAETLQKKQDEKDGDALFSTLYSDIGKKFYARFGWAPFQSTHLTLPAKQSSAQSVQPIGLDGLSELVKVDEQVIRSRYFTPGQPSDKTRVALLPDFDNYMRHLHREGFMCKHLFKRAPETHGALYGEGSSRRVWAVWTRGFYGPIEKPEKNTLYILRFVVEDESMSDDELKEAVKAVLGAAQNEAKEWQLPKVEIWNPDERIKRLAEDTKELEAKFVVRENDSITSLNWFGSDAGEEIEWAVNEKFEWC